MSNRILLSILALLLCGISSAQEIEAAQAQMPAGIKIVLEGHKLPAGSYGFQVQEIGSPQPLLEVNAEVPFNPASSIKALTTLAALELLGPAYTWHTDVYALGSIDGDTLHGDLLLRGGGDPYLLEEQFRNLLKAVQRQGIRHIDGRLLIDDTSFAPEVSAATLIDNQNSRAYNVRPYALSVNFQAVTFYFRPHANGRDVVIDSDPVLPNLAIDNRLRQVTGACTGFQRGISFETDPDNQNAVIFSGRFPGGCRQYALVRAVLSPQAFVHGLFSRLWQELGGTYSGSMANAVAPADSEPLMRWESPPLADVIRYLNKYSNNLMARHLLLTIGAEMLPGPATVEEGVEDILDWLQSFGTDVNGLVIANGSGLSREARISAAQMNAILQHGYEQNLMPEFVSSLPIAGEDGTMRYRLDGATARGAIHVKTGSLDEVSAIAGYVFARSGKVYAVSAMLNHELADRGPGVELMDALLRWAYQQ